MRAPWAPASSDGPTASPWMIGLSTAATASSTPTMRPTTVMVSAARATVMGILWVSGASEVSSANLRLRPTMVEEGS